MVLAMVVGGNKEKFLVIMDALLFVLSVLLIFLEFRAFHIYKCEYNDFDKDSLPNVVGSVIVVFMGGLAWYWVFKFLKML